MGTDTPAIAVAVYFRGVTLLQLSVGEKRDITFDGLDRVQYSPFLKLY